MDQSTSVLSEDVTPVLHNREAIAEKLVALERCLTDAAEDVTATYSRLLKETTDGVERLVDQAATALSPLHQTRAHPLVMLGVAVCAGYVLGRLQHSARPSP
jgi:hypothetical protein